MPHLPVDLTDRLGHLNSHSRNAVLGQSIAGQRLPHFRIIRTLIKRLGIKQLESDPFAEYAAANDKGTIVNGKVISVEAKAAVIELAEGIEGTLKVSEISVDRIDDAATVLSVGDAVEAKIITMDRRNRVINLSIKAKEQAEEKAAISAVRNAEVEVSGPTTIGDLIKAQLDNQK